MRPISVVEFRGGRMLAVPVPRVILALDDSGRLGPRWAMPGEGPGFGEQFEAFFCAFADAPARVRVEMVGEIIKSIVREAYPEIGGPELSEMVRPGPDGEPFPGYAELADAWVYKQTRAWDAAHRAVAGAEVN